MPCEYSLPVFLLKGYVKSVENIFSAEEEGHVLDLGPSHNTIELMRAYAQ